MAPPNSFTGGCHALGKYLPTIASRLVLAEERQPAHGHKDYWGVPTSGGVWSCGSSRGCDLAQQRCLGQAAPADADTPVHCSSPWERTITANDDCLNGSTDDKHGADPAAAPGCQLGFRSSGQAGWPRPSPAVLHRYPRHQQSSCKPQHPDSIPASHVLPHICLIKNISH